MNKGSGHMITIRPYRSADLRRVTAVFKQNVPFYFHKSEESNLKEYLDQHPQTYFLLEEYDGLMACGGYYVDARRSVARISWDFVASQFHGAGYGSALLTYRLKKINEQETVRSIVVHTSQLTSGFYQRFGFKIRSREKDHWARGFDLVVMEREI